MAHQIRKNIAERNLTRLLRHVDNEQLFIHAWAINAIQSGHEKVGRRIVQCPDEAITRDLSSSYFVHKWSLETLLNEALFHDKAPFTSPDVINTYRLNLSDFNSTATMINALKRLENVDDGLAGERVGILSLMPRLAHRQFPWQRGFFSIAQIYRSLFVYGHTLASEYFQQTYGIPLRGFFFCGFALISIVREHPGFNSDTDLTAANISDQVRDVTLSRLSAPHESARKLVRDLRATDAHTAYRKSVLRQFPMVSFGNNPTLVRAPLPQLVEARITEGLYYDLVGGGSAIWNEIGDRFEQYSFEYLTAMFPQLQIWREFRYGKRNLRSPDLFLGRQDMIDVVIECKAKKMTFEARFSETPLIDAAAGYEEIAKGISQLWTFFCHCRLGEASPKIADDAVGVVLTLDQWLEIANEQRKDVLDRAKQLSRQREPRIAEEDFRPVAFCTISDLEYVSRRSSSDILLACLKTASQERFAGYHLSSVLRDQLDNGVEKRGYPFEQEMRGIMNELGMPNEVPEGSAERQ